MMITISSHDDDANGMGNVFQKYKYHSFNTTNTPVAKIFSLRDNSAEPYNNNITLGSRNLPPQKKTKVR